MLPVHHFTEFIQKNQLFDSESKVLAAVSGGMDSVLMARLLSDAGYRFGIAHCNFQLRGAEALADQDFCRQLAGELNVQFHTINFDTTGYAASHHLSIQMAARNLRYQWFEQMREQYGYNVIALAHHQNDTIETILLNLTRGTGINGLHGILPKNGKLVRPMLFAARKEIENIAKQHNLPYREDSSNSSVKYARNKIRLEVVPRLKELNPGLEHAFERNLEYFRDMEMLLEREISKYRGQFVEKDGESHLQIQVIKELYPQRLLLYHLFKPYGFHGAQIDDLIRVLDKHSGRVFESAGYSLLLDRGVLILKKKTVAPLQLIEVNKLTSETYYSEYRFTQLHDDSRIIIKDNHMSVSVDAALLVYPLRLRTWQRGDYFCPLGMQSRQKVSDFFVHQKVPLHQKGNIPILVNGNQEIIWIGGYRLDDRYKVTDNTKKVAIFELYKRYE